MDKIRQYWTEKEVQQLHEWYGSTDLFVSDMAARLGRPRNMVYQKARQLGLRRPKEAQAMGGRIGTQSEAAKANRFRKGHTPANKGKKMSPETYAKVSRTMFKKGQIPRNHREVGSERIDTDGYIEVKVAEPNQWKPKHRLIWEQAHGPIKKGYNVQFKDGNSLNTSLDNLYLISRSQQLKEQNSLTARYPKELQELIRLRGTVKRQMTLYKKKESKNEQ